MNNSKKSLATLSATTVAMGLWLCSAMPSMAQENDDSVIYLNQGWTEEQRQYYYHASQGTAMLPLAFYQYLEQADSEDLISSAEFEASQGLLPAAKDEKYNPEGLPVGLTKLVVKEGLYKGEWVGFSCAACHTGELSYDGKNIRIDGGSSSSFSMPNYGKEIYKALSATLENEDKMNRLVDRSKGKVDMSRDEITAELQRIAKYINYFNTKITQSPHDFGPGRMDALTQIHNTLMGAYLGVHENIQMTMAPTKSPFVWNAPQSAWVQWSGVLHQPIYRNLGESLGAMSRVNLDPNKGEMFESTADLKAQIKIEKNLWYLSPPKWPEEVLGEIDQELAAKGEALVGDNCLACHSVYPHRWSYPRKKGKVFIENALVPHDYIGTDGMQFKAPLTSTLPEYLAGPMSDYLPEPYTGAVAGPGGVIQSAMKKHVADKYLPKLNLTEEQQLEILNYSDDSLVGPEGPHYKAAPLDGMWAVPPFLHNNSVPSIYALLMPAAERPKTWKQGRDFDPKNLGVDTSGNSGDFLVDTSRVGLSNAGHSFEDGPKGNGVIGRAFTEEERWAIVEYLKTLPTEEAQVTPYGGPKDPVNAWEDGTFFNATHKSGYEAKNTSTDTSEELKKLQSGHSSVTASEASSAKRVLGQEIIEKDEEKNIQRITDAVLKRMRNTYTDEQTMKRDAHAKTHGMVEAKLVVEKGLPEELRQGIFAEEVEYDALVRLSASSQIVVPDLVQQPHGMAIKLIGVEGKKLLEGDEDASTQDFVMINAPFFFLADLKRYADFFDAQMEGTDAVKKFAENNKDIARHIGTMVSDAGDVNNVFAQQYWSQTPYKYGPYTIKYSVKPITDVSNARPDVMLPEFLRTAMEQTVGKQELRYEFVIQLQRDPQKQPLEDPTVVWKPSETREIRVATLIIPKQDISDKKDIDRAEGMSFSVWRATEDHRPLGAVNRARHTVYMGGANLRRDENDVKDRAEPTELPSEQ